jgi:multisubunit Na+/H+ antiporter MnhB subunit
METTPQVKKRWSGLTVANLCCFAGSAMVVYAAFLLHSAAGFAISGGILFSYGVLSHRMTTDRAARPR